MSVAIVRKPARHFGLPFAAAVEELREDVEMTPTLVLVRLHQKSLLFPDIYYDRCGTHFTLMHDTGKGYNVGDPQKFLGALLQSAVTSGKDPSPKAKLPLAYLDLPVTSSLIDSCTRKYRDWTEESLRPEVVTSVPLRSSTLFGCPRTTHHIPTIWGRHLYPQISRWGYHP